MASYGHSTPQQGSYKHMCLNLISSQPLSEAEGEANVATVISTEVSEANGVEKSVRILKLTGSSCHTCESRYPVVRRVSGFPLPDQSRGQVSRE